MLRSLEVRVWSALGAGAFRIVAACDCSFDACIRYGTRVLTGLFLGSGTWILYHSGIPLQGYLGAFGGMVYLIALFAVVPVLCTPIRVGRYAMAIEMILRRRVKGAFGLNAVATALAYVVGSGSMDAQIRKRCRNSTDDRTGDLPVPGQGACAHARFSDHAGSVQCSR